MSDKPTDLDALVTRLNSVSWDDHISATIQLCRDAAAALSALAQERDELMQGKIPAAMLAMHDADVRLNHTLNAQLDYIVSCQDDKAKNPGDELLDMRNERDQARRTAEYWKAEHLAGNAEVARLAQENERLRALLTRCQPNLTTAFIAAIAEGEKDIAKDTRALMTDVEAALGASGEGK